MSRFEGKPYREIAENMGITVKGIDYHIALAVSKLRVALKDYLPLWIWFFFGL
jgi:RNA polymerase sigma-70 factor (ECF subfamily)